MTYVEEGGQRLREDMQPLLLLLEVVHMMCGEDMMYKVERVDRE